MERLMLLDGNGLIYRGYFALPPLTTSKGELVNAVFGFCSIVLRGIADIQPDYLAVAFDLQGPTFRHEQYAEYKATRQRMPDDLRDQFPKVREVVAALRIPVYELAGYEADDVIGTLTVESESRGLDTTIVTGDLDMLQLVTDRTRLMTTRSGVENTILYDPAKIADRFELVPGQMIDYKALKGDPTDNIPGVPGVGEKTAAKLIREYGTLDALYERIAEVKPDKLRDKLVEHRESVFMGRDLSTIVRDLPVTLDLDAARIGDYDRETVIRLFREFEFRSLIERLPPMTGESAVETAEALRGVLTGGTVPAARVAGQPRPAGWGPGQPPRPSADPGSLQLSLDFDSVAGACHANRGPARRSSGRRADAAEPGDLPAALAAAIADPDRIELARGDRIADLAPWLTAQAAVGVALVADDPRPRRGTPLAFAVAGADGRVIATEGPEDATALRRLVETVGTPIVGPRGQASARRAVRRRPGGSPGRRRVRYADRRLHPERLAAQPDHRRRPRRAARPHPPAGRRAHVPGAGRPRGAGRPCGAGAARTTPGRGRTRPAVRRDGTPADRRPRPDGGDGRRPRSRGAPPARHGVQHRDPPSRAGDLRRRRARVQPRQPQAARADPVLRAEPAQGQAHQDRILDRRIRPGGPPGRASDGREAPGVAGLHEAAFHVCRGAADPARRRRAPAHDVPPGRGRDRSPLLVATRTSRTSRSARRWDGASGGRSWPGRPI